MRKVWKRTMLVTLAASAVMTMAAAMPAAAAWQNTAAGWRYTDGANQAVTGWRMIDGSWYYFNAGGVMQTGWVWDGGHWYYCNAGGAMQTGWIWDGSHWYYCDASGAMRTGWVRVGSHWYYCNASGVMQTGWVQDGSASYFCNSSGEMQTGFIQIDGVNYEFNASGALLGERSGTVFAGAAFTSDGKPAELVTQAEDGETVWGTIPEGKSAGEIAEILESKGVCRAEDFLRALNQYQTTSATFDEFKNNPDLLYYYEGCLYPDTYEFYCNSDPSIVIRRMLINFDNKMTDELKAQMEEKGLSLLETITLASIVQQEAGKPEDMAKVAAVFWNRLENPSQFPKLQSNPTTEYAESSLPGANASADPSAYDTYQVSGLPAGPICNPGMDAIQAVLNPEEDFDAYFFCTDRTGHFYFAETLAEHKENIAAAQEVNASLS